jgi:hypothetical protein
LLSRLKEAAPRCAASFVTDDPEKRALELDPTGVQRFSLATNAWRLRGDHAQTIGDHAALTSS